jgi:hypothetical protein
MKLLLAIEPVSQEPDETFDMDASDPDAGNDLSESAPVSEGRDTLQCCPDFQKQPCDNKSGEPQSSEPSAPENIDVLLAAAKKLYDGARRKETALLTERIEIGGILIKLKAEVGHGNFIRKFREWVALGKLNFSLSIGDRAMAYAELADAGKLRTVRNLAEAERVRKAEAARKKAEKKAAMAAEDNKVGGAEAEQQPPAKLTKEQAICRAQFLAKPAFDECRSYEVETRIVVLEELIELLTEEFEKLTEEPEP